MHLYASFFFGEVLITLRGLGDSENDEADLPRLRGGALPLHLIRKAEFKD